MRRNAEVVVQFRSSIHRRHPERSAAKSKDVLLSLSRNAARRESKSFDCALRAPLRMTGHCGTPVGMILSREQQNTEQKGSHA